MKERTGNPVGRTRPWRPEEPRALPPGPVEDPGRPVFEPVIERTSPRHARVYGMRRLEAEVMDETGDAEAYMDAAAQAHLARLDASWIEQVLAFGPRRRARVLDVGTGGGQIPARIAARRSEWRIWAVDRSRAMLAAGTDVVARLRAGARARARPLRLATASAEARALPFSDGAFDVVISNSLLHHLGDPTPVLDEIARVAGRSGRVLLRDLRRPPRGLLSAWVAWHGRRYTGAMRRLYADSVAAAFTPEELAIVVGHSRLEGARVAAAGPYLVVARG